MSKSNANFTDFLKNNSEPLSICLMVGFVILTLYILLSCVDPAESAAAREREIEHSKTCRLAIEKENKDQERYQRLLKKLDKITSSQMLDTHKSLITTLNSNEENIAVKVSKYVNDRGGNQFRGQPGNWYTSFAEQARMLYR